MHIPAPIKPLMEIELGLKDVADAVLLPDDDTLVMGVEPDPRLHLVSLASGVRRTVPGHSRAVNTVTLADEGRLLVSGSDDGTVRVWDTETWDTKLVLKGHTDFVRNVAAVGMVAVSGSEDHTVRVWDLTSGSCRAVFEGHEHSVDRVALSPDGAQAVSASRDNHVMVWDLASGTGRDLYRSDQKVWTVNQNAGIFSGSFMLLGRNESGKGHQGGPSAMLFGSDSGTLYTADDEIITWNLATGTERARSEHQVQSMGALARHPETGRLAAASSSQISVYSADAEYLFGFGAEKSTAEYLAFTGDGRLVAIDGFGTVSVWPAVTGNETDGFRHRGGVAMIAMDPTGRRAATVDSDNGVMVWELATGRREAAFTAEGRWSFETSGQLAFTLDGQRLVSLDARSLSVFDIAEQVNSAIIDRRPKTMWLNRTLVPVDNDTVFVNTKKTAPVLWSLKGLPPQPMTGGSPDPYKDPVITDDGRYVLSRVTLRPDDPQLRMPVDVEGPLGVCGLQCWDLTTRELVWTSHGKSDLSGFPAYTWFFVQAHDTVLVSGDSGELLLLDLTTGDIRDRLPEPFSEAFHTPPHRLAGGVAGFFTKGEEPVRLWTVTEQGFVQDPRFAVALEEWAEVELVIPGADLVITRDRCNIRRRHSLSTGEPVSGPDISREARVLAATPDGSTIVVGDRAGYVHIIPSRD